jgi:hypothetical protein
MEGLNSSNIRLLYSALYGRYGSEKTPIKNVNTLLKNNLKNRRNLKKVKRVSVMAEDLRDIIKGK